MGVVTILLHQFLVRSTLNRLTFGQNDDLIGHADRRETMGNQNGHLLLGHFAKVIAEGRPRNTLNTRKKKKVNTFAYFVCFAVVDSPVVN